MTALPSVCCQCADETETPITNVADALKDDRFCRSCVVLCHGCKQYWMVENYQVGRHGFFISDTPCTQPCNLRGKAFCYGCEASVHPEEEEPLARTIVNEPVLSPHLIRLLHCPVNFDEPVPASAELWAKPFSAPAPIKPSLDERVAIRERLYENADCLFAELRHRGRQDDLLAYLDTGIASGPLRRLVEWLF